MKVATVCENVKWVCGYFIYYALCVIVCTVSVSCAINCIVLYQTLSRMVWGDVVVLLRYVVLVVIFVVGVSRLPYKTCISILRTRGV